MIPFSIPMRYIFVILFLSFQVVYSQKKKLGKSNLFNNFSLQTELSNNVSDFNTNYNKALKIALNPKNDSLLLELKRLKIDFYQRNYLFKESLIEIEKLITNKSEYFKNIGFSRKGIYLFYTGNNKLALEYLLKANNYFSIKDNKRELAIIKNGLGNLYTIEFKFDKAIGLFTSAYKQLPQNSYLIQRNLLINNLTSSYTMVNNLKMAEFYLQEHELLMEKNPKNEIIKFSYYFNAANYFANKDKSKSRNSLSSLKKIVFKNRKNHQLGLYYQTSSRINYFSNEYKESLKNIDSALYFLKKGNANQFITHNLNNKINIFKKTNDFKKAFQALEEYNSYKKKSNEILVDAYIQESKLKYNNVNQKLALTKLKLENEQKEKDKKIYMYVVIFSIILLAFALFILYQKTKQIKIQKKIFYSKISSNTISTVLKTENRERKRISNELHNIIGAKMAVLKLMTEEQLQDKENSEVVNDKIPEFIDEIVDEIRQISHNLLPQNIKALGLNNSIIELVNSINSKTKLSVDYFSNGLEEEIDEYYALFIYRTIQEFFNNILKHSKASETILNIFKNNNEIQITIEDNGVGFDTSDKKMGQGINEIKNYIHNVDGVFEIESSAERGTLINLKFTLTDTSKLIW